MDNKQKSVLSAAVAASLCGVGAADAASITIGLVGIGNYVGGSGFAAGNISSSTATWSYDTVTTVLTQTGGTFNVRFSVVPTTTLFHHSATGLIIGNAAAAAASTYICTEGNFGNNFTNESTSNWGPGTAFAPGSPNSCAIVGGSNEGYRWTLSTVPVPGAVWLFGCALGLMGVMRRKISS